MEYTRLRHSGLSVCRICLVYMILGVAEPKAQQPEDELVPNSSARQMDDLTALRSLGLSLPSPAYLFGALVFGLIGIGAYWYGKRSRRPRTKWLGVALMLYPQRHLVDLVAVCRRGCVVRGHLYGSRLTQAHGVNIFGDIHVGGRVQRTTVDRIGKPNPRISCRLGRRLTVVEISVQMVASDPEESSAVLISLPQSCRSDLYPRT